MSTFVFTPPTSSALSPVDNLGITGATTEFVGAAIGATEVVGVFFASAEFTFAMVVVVATTLVEGATVETVGAIVATDS
jgi:hypothetical protein